MTIDRTSLLAVLFTFAAAHGALQELQRDPEGRGVSLEIGQLWQKQLRCGCVLASGCLSWVSSSLSAAMQPCPWWI